MKSYGVCFEFNAEKKEDAERVRGIIEVVAKAMVLGKSGSEPIEISECMKPSLYEFDTLEAAPLFP